MELFWQNTGVLAAVALAVVYLARRLVLRRRMKSGCANCMFARAVRQCGEQAPRNAPR